MSVEVNKMETPVSQYVVGIDIAKQSHTVCVLRSSDGVVVRKPFVIQATREGWEHLLEQLGHLGPASSCLIGMEATGILWEPLYDSLTHADYSVIVLNPRQTANWSASLGLRAKTDSLDAQTIAKGVRMGLARSSAIPSETIQALRTLTRTRADLIQSRTAALQRLQDELVAVFPELPTHLPPAADGLTEPVVLHLLAQYGSAQAIARLKEAELAETMAHLHPQRWGKAEAHDLYQLAHQSLASTRAVKARQLVVQTLAKHLLDLHERIAELEKALNELLKMDEDAQRLQQIPGIGPVISATILAEVGDIQRFASVDQVIAYAGLDPQTRQSGKYEGQRKISKRGPGTLRHVLYLASVVAIRIRPEWKRRYDQLLARGRAKKEALTILSRLLLKVIVHLLRTSSFYDSSKIGMQRS